MLANFPVKVELAIWEVMDNKLPLVSVSAVPTSSVSRFPVVIEEEVREIMSLAVAGESEVPVRVQ